MKQKNYEQNIISGEVNSNYQVEAFEDYLQIFDKAKQRTSRFHFFWLRHHCPCCVHQATKERIISPLDFSFSIVPRYLNVNEQKNELEIVWDSADGHNSRFNLDWLWENHYDDGETLAYLPHKVDDYVVDAQNQTPDELFLKDFTHRLYDKNIVIVKNAGGDTQLWIDKLSDLGLKLSQSHFGRIEDLRVGNTTNENTDQLGYTNYRVDLHTDLPFIESTPPFQMLHCVQPAENGGENYFVDAVAAAEYLKKVDHQAFHLLSTVRVHFHRKQANYESSYSAPILCYGVQKLEQIRYSYFTMAPFHLPFGQMADWYRAYRVFERIVSNPKHQIRIKLNQNDLVIYNNWRVLHGRESFEGERWLRGVFFSY